MPSQPAIVLRPGQQTGLVSLSGGGLQQNRHPILATGGVRVQGPGVGGRAAASITANRNVVINQPGLGGQPGSQITVPLQTLQTLQPGQGIPTGQAGHLIVKTVDGRYQILQVGTSTSAGSNTGSVSTVNSLSHQMVRPSGVRTTSAAPSPSMNLVQRAPTVAAVAKTVSQSGNSVNSATVAATGGASSAGGGGGMGTQMTPDTAKHKCKNFLATLLRLAGEQPANVATNVRNLIQGLIDGKVDPDTFTTKLQKELHSSPQPCLVPFLKRSLPYLQQSLLNGELSIDGVRAPLRPMIGSATKTTIMRPQFGLVTNQRAPLARPPQMSVMRTMSPQVSGSPTVMRTMPPKVIQHQIMNKNFMSTASPTLARVGALNAMPGSSMSPMMSQQIKEKKSSNSYSVAGDEDINDVAAMGGVNLAEESQRMQGSIVAGTQIRSCKDETFLQTGLLHKRVAKICRDRGLDEPSSEVIALVSHATQDRLKTLLEKLSVISEHRLDIVKQEGDYEVTQDVKGQLRFLGELDKIERRRHEEAERELLLRAAKSRTKTEDPEKEKLKAKAKELQRLEEEQIRHEKANNTALLAIGGNRKKMKLDGEHISGIASSLASRPRTKRVHVRDLMFLMEQEKELKRSPLLWKAYCS
jgi:transcription initiation factor TFIID subunit 4